MHKLPLITFCSFVLAVQAAVATDDLDEASGVVVHSDRFIVVSDDEPHVIYIYPVSLLPGIGEARDLPMPNDDNEHPISHRKARELEDIALLDGQSIFLCEKTSTICDHKGVLFEYGDRRLGTDGPTVGEQGKKNKGLESLAVRRLNEDKSLIAVATEGRNRSPRIFVHEIENDKVKARRSEEAIKLTDVKTIRVPEKLLREQTDLASDDDFRITAMVFAQEQGAFIVLLQHNEEPEKKWLLKVNNDGIPIAVHALPEGHARPNWEGLAWWGDDKLVLINDNGGQGATSLLTIAAPKGW